MPPMPISKNPNLQKFTIFWGVLGLDKLVCQGISMLIEEFQHATLFL